MSRWPTRSLEDIAEIFGGGTPSRENPAFWDGDVLWVTPTDLPMPDEGISVVHETKDRITALGLSSSSATLLPKGSVLFSSRATIGKVAVNDREVTTNQGFANFVPRAGIAPRYLAYALWYYKEDISRLSGSTTFKEVSRGNLRKFEIPVPPLAEQERIVKLLDEADALRKLRAEAGRRTAELIPALFYEIFGDPVRNEKGWEVRPLGNHLEFLTSGSRGWAKYYSEEGDLFLRIQNVGLDDLLLNEVMCVNPPDTAEARRTKVQSGDILLSITADLGRAAVVPPNFPKAHINQHLALLRVSGIEPGFVSAALCNASSRRKWLELNRSGVKSGLSFADIRQFPIVVPPAKVQKQFVGRSQRTKSIMGVQALNGCKVARLSSSVLDEVFSERN